jgi:hypothetical protein
MSSDVDMRWRIRRALAERWQPALVGGVAFWLPDVLYDYVKRSEPTATGIWALTLIMPFAVSVAYLLMKSRAPANTRSLALSMLLGVWLLGPTMIGLGQTFRGAGLRDIHAVAVIIFGTVFPPLILIMAGYDLSIMALLLGTVSLLLARRIYERPARTQQVAGNVGRVGG